MKKIFLIFLGLISFSVAYAQTTSEAPKNVFAENVQAITSLAYPVLILVIFCILYPQIKNIIKSRGFSIKVAGMELNVQNMADQLSEQIHELQKKVIELACAVEDNKQANPNLIMPPGVTNKKSWRVLWVTGKHENHAFEIGYLEKDGVEVTRANSTKEALEILREQPNSIDAIVTGVSRRENNVVIQQAGIELIRKVKAEGFKTPVFVMCSEKSIRDYYEKLKDEGAVEATSSSLDLLAFLKGAGINCSRQLKANSNQINSNITAPN